MILGFLAFIIIILLPISIASMIAASTRGELHTRRFIARYGGKCPRCKSIHLRPATTIVKTSTTEGNTSTTTISNETTKWVCSTCGNQFTREDNGQKPTRKSKRASKRAKTSQNTAKWLAIILGLVGADSFYLRHTWFGILRILLTVSGVGLIISIPWWIISAVTISKHKDDWSEWVH